MGKSESVNGSYLNSISESFSENVVNREREELLSALNAVFACFVKLEYR